jgi:hypothetical protein
MKRTFLKVLPFAAAVLLATSCSKDDNNSTDEIVNGGAQIETVTKTVKTLTIKGKVKQSISKVTTNSEGTALAFEANDVFTFGQEGDAVYGTITILDANGNYTATVNYTDEGTLLSSDGFTATHGENPLKISEGYSTLAAAVQHACYETVFTISYDNANEKYSLASVGSSDIVINLKSAFIKALSAESTTLGGDPITVEADNYYVVAVGKAMGNSGKNTLAGQIYSLGTPENCIAGVFSVSADKKVYFSKGNLQATYNGSTWSWGFAANQWDYVGEATANTTINGNGTVSTNGTVDLFGWVGASSNFEGAAQYGISNSETTDNVNGYGNVENESLKSDWGKVFGSDSPWRTLTGGNSGEWKYLLNTRATTSGVRYAMAQVNGVQGLIIVPDDWNADTYTLQSTNTPYVGFTTNTIDKDTWTNTLEKAGAVFLPASGRRYGSEVIDAGSYGRYWSSSALNMFSAYLVGFSSGDLDPAGNFDRYGGFSVRLVRVAE